VADEVGPLTPEVEPVVTILSMIPLAKFVASSRGHVGHPRCDRQRLATAFIAKAVLSLHTTRQLLDRLQAGDNSSHFL